MRFPRGLARRGNLRRALVMSLWVAAPLAWSADVDLSKPIRQVPASSPIAVAGKGATPVMEFALWRTAVSAEDIVGEWDDGLLCTKYSDLRYTKRSDDALLAHVTKAFKEEAARLGYALSDNLPSLFESKPAKNVELRVGATLMQFDERFCGRRDLKGAAYAMVKWELYSVSRQKVIYEATLESGASVPDRVPAREFDRRVALSIVDALFADAKFVEAVQSTGAQQAATVPPAASTPTPQ